MTDFELTKFDYAPGRPTKDEALSFVKGVRESLEEDIANLKELEELLQKPDYVEDCGHLRLEATTPIGKLVWNEIVPGPRHGEDSRELTVTLNEVEIDLCDNNIELDFEPPCKQGKWSELFADSGQEVGKQLEDWFTSHEETLRSLTNQPN